MSTCRSWIRSARTTGRAGASLHPKRYPVAEHLALHQGGNLLNDVIDVERRFVGVGLFREATDTPDPLACPEAILDDHFQVLARFVQVWSAAAEPKQAGLGVDEEGAEWLANFVGDGGGEFAQSCHARDMRELCLRSLQLLLGSFGCGNIHQRAHELQFTWVIPHDMGDNMEMFDGAVRH